MTMATVAPTATAPTAKLIVKAVAFAVYPVVTFTVDALMLTPCPIKVSTRVRLIVIAMPTFTATAPVPIADAAAIALVRPLVVTFTAPVTPEILALQPMAEVTFASKYVTAADTLTATKPALIASVAVITSPKSMLARTFTFCAAVTLPASSAFT